ncbi:MAG: peptidylprolyl isomerase, partial [Bacteroidota bacterium]
EESIPQIIKSRQREKYMSLVANSTYVPKWMAEKMYADNNLVASIDFVNVPYSTVADSTIRISDDQISEYISSHKEQYKQEESRSIAYVAFNAAPTSADSAKVFQQLMNLKQEFDTTKDVAAFIARNGSESGFLDSYLPKSKIQVPKKDSIFPLKNGEVYGPYLDVNTYVLAKKIDEKQLPDSVKARHILVAIADPKTGQQIMDDSTAKKKIDSIKALIDKGERFDSVAAKLSDDEGSKAKGGELGYFPAGQMVKEFNDFCFEGKKGDKKIVKTQFGYHYIEIEDQKNFEPAYKIAYLSKSIEASPNTTDSVNGVSNLFAGQSRNLSNFEDNIKKQNLQRLVAVDILPTASTIQGLGSDRQFVRWIYDDKTSVGDVSEPYVIGDKYVVAALTEINKKGTMSVAKARPLVEPILRNKQKADIIIKKIGTISSLDAVASATGQQVVKSDTVNFASPYIPNAGKEDKVIGSSFNKQWQGKAASDPIADNGGVFVIKVNSVSAKANTGIDIDQLRATQQRQLSSMISFRAIDVLTNAANVKDYRGKFF